jgi:hypothetical protein
MNAVTTSLYSTLSGGTALTSLLAGTTSVYNQQAPDAAVLPYVVFSKQGGGPENIDPGDRRDLTYYVRGYAATSKRAGEIDNAIDGLLHKKTLTLSGWRNFWTTRQTDIELVETGEDGEKTFSSGALYRIRIT